MKIYSEKLKRLFDTANECLEAEDKYDAEKAEAEKKKKQEAEGRKIASKRVEDAYTKLSEARKDYEKELSSFCEKYGSYHCTYDKNTYPTLLRTFFDFL